MRPKRILIVENDARTISDVQHKVESLGYEVSAVVSSGKEAVGHPEMAGTDLVLMNLKLNHQIVKGKTANQVIRERFRIPVVYLSSENPLEAETLKSVLEKVLKIYRS